MSLQAFYGKNPHRLLLAGFRQTRGKMTLTVVPTRLNYCINFILCALLTNVAEVHIIEPGWPRFGDPFCLIIHLLIGRSQFRVPKVHEIILWLKTSDRNMALGSNQPLTQVSIKDQDDRCMELTILPPSCADCL